MKRTTCGCIGQVRDNTKHGHTIGKKQSKTYSTWHAMIDRCTRKRNRKYGIYGGRGIAVCERWKDFINFLSDMGEKPVGKSLGRIDGDKGYYPENCRWETIQEQRASQRPAIHFHAHCL